VPVHRIVTHLTLVYTYRSTTRVTGLGVQGLEAWAAVGPQSAHDVTLATQVSRTLETFEVTSVPTLTLRLSTLRSEDYLTHNTLTCLRPSNTHQARSSA